MKSNSVIIICDGCGKQLSRCPSLMIRNKNNFCSYQCKSKAERASLIGQIFNDWEVLEFSHTNKSGNIFYKCKCKCGKIKPVVASSLRSKVDRSKRCPSCSKRKYVGEISGSFFCDLKSRAIKYGYDLEITHDDIWEQYLKQGKKCYYSGLDLTWQDGVYGERGISSVDRLDSTKGYTKDNIVICHKMINFMKLDYTEDEFIDMCKTITSYQNNKGVK